MRLCPTIGNEDALRVYVCDTEGISGIRDPQHFRLMPISLLFGASETDVVSSCRNVRRVQAAEGGFRGSFEFVFRRSDAVYLAAGDRSLCCHDGDTREM